MTNFLINASTLTSAFLPYMARYDQYGIAGWLGAGCGLYELGCFFQACFSERIPRLRKTKMVTHFSSFILFGLYATAIFLDRIFEVIKEINPLALGSLSLIIEIFGLYRRSLIADYLNKNFEPQADKIYSKASTFSSILYVIGLWAHPLHYIGLFILSISKMCQCFDIFNDYKLTRHMFPKPQSINDEPVVVSRRTSVSEMMPLFAIVPAPLLTATPEPTPPVSPPRTPDRKKPSVVIPSGFTTEMGAQNAALISSGTPANISPSKHYNTMSSQLV